MAQRPCLTCNQLTTGSYCDTCKSAKEAKRNSSRIYSSGKWKTVRKKALDMAEGICQSCGIAVATSVDHIRPLAEGGEPYDLDNLQALCWPCHAAKNTREQQQQKGKQ